MKRQYRAFTKDDGLLGDEIKLIKHKDLRIIIEINFTSCDKDGVIIGGNDCTEVKELHCNHGHYGAYVTYDNLLKYYTDINNEPLGIMIKEPWEIMKETTESNFKNLLYKRKEDSIFSKWSSNARDYNTKTKSPNWNWSEFDYCIDEVMKVKSQYISFSYYNRNDIPIKIKCKRNNYIYTIIMIRSDRVVIMKDDYDFQSEKNVIIRHEYTFNDLLHNFTTIDDKPLGINKKGE